MAIGIICDTEEAESEELLDPIEDAFSAQWNHDPDWNVYSGTYPCQYIDNEGVEINNLLFTEDQIFSIDIALEKCR